ncbi:MAG: hypothetical protein PHC64_04555 [Candidatus Gastranaerophilales bacterium]|nr:hypothetical protein [Candidatus Gastranaerophilales bacterium]
MLLKKKTFSEYFNMKIFESSKSELLQKISQYPDRYTGIFRPTKPKMKIIQNLTQSHEIKFGDAIEYIMERYFETKGFEILEKQIKTNDGVLNLDQCLKKDNKIIMIEQKVRDDHDSTKKRGQIDNFEKKVYELAAIYGEQNILAYFYFIDPSLIKNKRYYQQELLKIQKNYEVKCQLLYGDELFKEINCLDIWDELIYNLKQWKHNLPEFPEINFDKNAVESFNEIKDIKPIYWLKFFDNEEIIKEIIPVIFPQKKTLFLLKDFFKQNHKQKVYKTLYIKLNTLLED